MSEGGATFPRPNRRDLLLGGVAAAAGGIAYARMPDRQTKLIRDGELDRIVPNQVGEWRYETMSGLVLPPPDQLSRLVYSQQVARTYLAPGLPPVMALFAYGSSQGGMFQIHRPETCYPASGFRLSDVEVEALDLGRGRRLPVRCFTAHSDTRVEQVMYWTRIGNFLPSSWTEQRIAVMRSNLAGDMPDGLLARASILTEDVIAGRRVIAEFVRMMLAEIPVGQRRALVGSAA